MLWGIISHLTSSHSYILFLHPFIKFMDHHPSHNDGEKTRGWSIAKRSIFVQAADPRAAANVQQQAGPIWEQKKLQSSFGHPWTGDLPE